MLLGVAATGAFEPVWSPRILEEWARAAIKLGPTGETQARAEIALLRAAWPEAERAEAPHVTSRLWLPDPNDIHVLATAVSSSSDAILTLNAKDFPKGVLAEEGIARLAPDEYLYQCWQSDPASVEAAAAAVLADARRLSGAEWEMRALLKKARLPRLAKAVG